VERGGGVSNAEVSLGKLQAGPSPQVIPAAPTWTEAGFECTSGKQGGKVREELNVRILAC
jgi:hypothetical protein